VRVVRDQHSASRFQRASLNPFICTIARTARE
jgi:hypothetical protein